jgi:hypothetical protein
VSEIELIERRSGHEDSPKSSAESLTNKTTVVEEQW